MIKIDRGISINSIKIPCEKWQSQFPFSKMAVGDSFLLPKETDRKKFSGMLTHYNRKMKLVDKKYKTRTTEDGVRVWHVR
tara:strand:- start:207 stop:446 length:240 start_codon:yes stop_codon:yes gene_type:complete